MKPPYIEQKDSVEWKEGCYTLRGTKSYGVDTLDWNLNLRLSNWDPRQHTYDAVLSCGGYPCMNGNEELQKKGQFKCSKGDPSDCVMEFGPFAFKGSNGSSFKLHRIYGTTRNISMDIETEHGVPFHTKMTNVGHPR